MNKVEKMLDNLYKIKGSCITKKEYRTIFDLNDNTYKLCSFSKTILNKIDAEIKKLNPLEIGDIDNPIKINIK